MRQWRIESDLHWPRSHQYSDSYFCAIGPDLRNVHRVAQDGQRMKRARTLGPHFITDLPDAFRQMIDEESDFAIAQFLVKPFRAACEIDGRREIHERRVLTPERPGSECLSISLLAA